MKAAPMPIAAALCAPRPKKPPLNLPDHGAETALVLATVRATLGDVFDPGYLGAAAAEHGRPFPTVAPSLPTRMRVGASRCCHQNSRRIALRDSRFSYVEGVASPASGAWGTMRLSHAWLVDEDDAVVDRTWDAGEDYHGVVVPISTLRTMATFARRKRECLGFVTDFDGRQLLGAMGVTLEQALRGL